MGRWAETAPEFNSCFIRSVLTRSQPQNGLAERDALEERHRALGETQENRNSPKGERLFRPRTFSSEERRLSADVIGLQVHKSDARRKGIVCSLYHSG